nr:glycosyltransferase [Priestia taiwanensis]
MKIATILDEFSSECFKYEANLLPLTPKNWRQVIDEENPALLLVESAWQGYKGTWYCRITELHKRSYTDLQDLVSYCKERGIPTIFWDKEGKDNFESFKEAASYFDYIFVTDENNIDNFKTVVTHTNIYPLSFAAQPRIHNPINKNKHKLGTIAFSGSWYGDKHPDRIKDVENIITPATRIGLDIYDRFFGIDNKNLTSRTWPELFQNSIVGKLDYNFMVEAYKNYDIFLNVNSIQNSKYMFSRRVYEVLASKTVVVSGDSIGVREQLGDYVHISDSPARTELLLRILTQSPLKMQREAKLAHRFILQNHTYTHRINEMLDIVGLPYKKSHSKKISVVLVTNRPQFMDNILDNLSAQTYEDREHIIVVNSDDIVMEKWEKKFSSLKNTKIYKVASAKSLGYCLNYGISKSIGDVIAKMDDDDYYAPNYLRDMVAIFDYTDASIVGKSVYYTYFEESNILVKRQIKGSGEDCYTRFVAGATLMFKREVYEAMGSFENRNTGEDTKFIEYAIKLGFKIYSDDSYNFCVIRRKEKNSHTWQISDEDMLKQGTICAYTNDYKTFVTI